jgi:hypothetical protein
MTRGSLFAIALVLTAVVGCRDPFAPPLGTSELIPPAAYRVAWRQVEECAGLSGAFDRVQWFVVPHASFPCGEGYCAGLWHEPHDIFLSEFSAADSIGGYFTVRHEILHDLLAGVADHPPVFAACGLLRSDHTAA